MTWQDPKSKNMWLEDFLPDAFPNARIMTFGYNSALAFGRNRAGIESFAIDLLNRVRAMRSMPQVSQTFGSAILNHQLTRILDIKGSRTTSGLHRS